MQGIVVYISISRQVRINTRLKTMWFVLNYSKPMDLINISSTLNLNREECTQSYIRHTLNSYMYNCSILLPVK